MIDERVYLMIFAVGVTLTMTLVTAMAVLCVWLMTLFPETGPHCPGMDPTWLGVCEVRE